MLAIEDKLHDVLKQLSVHLETLVATYLLGVLLHGPYCPQGHIRLFNLVYLSRCRLVRHKCSEITLSCLHHLLEIVNLTDGKCKSGQSDKCIACAALEPRISGHKVAVLVLLLAVELVGGGNQTVIEVITWHTVGHLVVEEFLHCRWLNGRSRSSKDDALTFLDRHLEISGHVEVLI